MLIDGITCRYSLVNDAKNLAIDGNANWWLNQTPVPRNTVAVSTNGMTTFFSRAYRPGATNSQNCENTKGEAMIKPAKAPTFNSNMKASASSVANSLPVLLAKYASMYWLSRSMK